MTDASSTATQGFSRSPRGHTSRPSVDDLDGSASAEATKDFPARKSSVFARATSDTEVHVPDHPMSSAHLSLSDAAMAHAQAGYPVIPLKAGQKARRTRKGTQASCDRAVVRRWWTSMPDSNIGIVLDHLPIVVLDVDGPNGRDSLARLLALAGLDHLPDTYTVTTGRPDGGRHYWYRLPPGAVKLVNQGGVPTSLFPKLDILFQNVAVAPGSVHKSGAVYLGNAPEMPVVSALTEMPWPLYQVLAQRGRPKVSSTATAPPRPRQSALVQTRSWTTLEVPPHALPPWVKALLADGSYGYRNHRTFKAVTGLVRLGLDDQNVIATVLASPLGARARDESNPQAWLQDKIDAARRYVPHDLDHDAFWVGVHNSGMSAGKVRILDTLLGCANKGGLVQMSQGWIGIDSAVKYPAAPVRSLVKQGWLVVLEAGTMDQATLYRLSIPNVGDEKCHTQICPPPSPPPSQYGLCVAFYAYHDAFRNKAGSLNSAYPLLTVLRTKPQSMDTLASWLRVKPRALRDRAQSLVTAGLAVQIDGGLALTGGPVLPLLDAVAVKVGTAGDRLLAIEVYYAQAEAFRLARAEAAVVGSPTWRKMAKARWKKRLTKPDSPVLIELPGGPLDTFAPYALLVERHGGDVDAAVTYRVEQEVQTNDWLHEPCPRLSLAASRAGRA